MSAKYYTGRSTGITDWPAPDPGAVLAKQSSEKRAVALLDLVIAIHNKAIEEAAKIAKSRVTQGEGEYGLGCDDTALSIANEILGLKRAP